MNEPYPIVFAFDLVGVQEVEVVLVSGDETVLGHGDVQHGLRHLGQLKEVFDRTTQSPGNLQGQDCGGNIDAIFDGVDAFS